MILSTDLIEASAALRCHLLFLISDYFVSWAAKVLLFALENLDTTGRYVTFDYNRNQSDSSPLKITNLSCAHMHVQCLPYLQWY